MPKPRVLVDTCIIIEAFRTQCWTALCHTFSVETVEKCVEECATGDPYDTKRTIVRRPTLLASLACVHAVSVTDLLNLSDQVKGLPAIDDGERHMMAWLHANQPVDVALLLSTSDRAAIRAANALGLLAQVSSLESLGKTAGVDKAQLSKLKEHFSEQWLSSARLKIKMGIV
ncbi:MAG: hypothetical protein ABL934_02235 [Lysobacteraceae bacterium]